MRRTNPEGEFAKPDKMQKAVVIITNSVFLFIKEKKKPF